MNGATAEYLVPSNATLLTVAAGLAESINSISNVTQVTASAIGDRIALRSTNPYKAGEQIPVIASASAPSGAVPTTFVIPSRSNFVDSFVLPLHSFGVPDARLSPGDSLYLRVKTTNGTWVAFSATNNDLSGSALALVQSLASQVNSNPLLQVLTGVTAEVRPSTNSNSDSTLVLQARTPGLASSLIQVALSNSSSSFWFSAVTNQLDSNLSDTQPRNHLFICDGVTNLALVFPFDTTTLSDGHHELTAVSYEGSHVRTQTHVTQSVVISNTPLAASFAMVVGDSRWAVEGTLAFSVSANANPVAAIELFSTGGSLGVVSNQASATFSVSGALLGAGLHPFYAVVTFANGVQYRTETKWSRLVEEESPFRLTITGNPPLLSWPAVGGRRYDILSAGYPTNGFQLRETIWPTNDLGQWSEPVEHPGSNIFYRVRSSW